VANEEMPMSSIINFAPPSPPPSPPSSPDLRRIRALSGGLEKLFSLLRMAALVLVGLEFVVPWAGWNEFIYVGPVRFFISDHPIAGATVFGAFPLGERVAYGLVCAGRTIPVLFVFDYLRQLFGLYRRGVMFSRMNTLLIKGVGLALVAEAAIPLVTHWVLMWLGLELHPNWRPPLSNLQPAILGAVVWVIALVMQAGHEIEQDREGFV
jgi:Protein of unknown function (DUF2975)